MIEKYKPAVAAMFQNFIVFAFTYVIAVLCVYMFEGSGENTANADPLSWMESKSLIHSIAATTITYCLSIILKNLFVTKRTMYITIISIGLSIVYILIYVSTINNVMGKLSFWIGTLVLIAFSLASEMEAIIHTQTFINKKRYFEVFSA